MTAHGMTRFWVEFDQQEGLPLGSEGGVGVTALDRDDALRLITKRIFDGGPLPPITEIREDVDVSTLDERHVIPNMEPPHRRGIWFPRGYV